MKIQLGLLETKVARRLLMLFVLSAILPIGALAVLSYRQIARYLESQADGRLQASAEQLERTITDRLGTVDTEVAFLVGLLRDSDPASIDLREFDASTRAIAAAAWERSTGTIEPLFGTLGDRPWSDPTGRPRLEDDHLMLLQSGEHAPNLYIVRHVDPGAPEGGVLWARVDSDFLWPVTRPHPRTAVRVLSSPSRLLHGEPMPDNRTRRRVGQAIQDNETEPFSLDLDGERHRAVRRPIELPDGVGSNSWSALVTQPESAVIAPLWSSAQGLLPILLTALLAVLIVSDAQIRRTIQPLKRLKEATGRVAEEDFTSLVEVRSNDEFEDLAESFNAMTRRLGAQFETLTVISEVDRAALSSADAHAVIDLLLPRLHGIVESDVVSVCLIDSEGAHAASVRSACRGQMPEVVNLTLTDADVELLRSNPDEVVTDVVDGCPGFLRVPCIERSGATRVLSLPFFFEGQPVGALSYTVGEEGSGALTRARQVTDQISLALSNVRRLRALDRLNWGALTALARTIDANSPWTAGHSERVATVATLLGKRMGLAADRVELLQRSALLHDIGKIGVSVDILNKTGPLLEDEMDEIREHTVIGARILEPITDYAALIPIVLHHHERIDGLGYPDGLRGDQIPLEARILAVADTLDALISDRPYRPGLPFKTAMEVMRNAAGSQLDESVVAALLSLVDDDEIDPNAGRWRAEPGRSWVDEASVKRVSLA